MIRIIRLMGIIRITRIIGIIGVIGITGIVRNNRIIMVIYMYIYVHVPVLRAFSYTRVVVLHFSIQILVLLCMTGDWASEGMP